MKHSWLLGFLIACGGSSDQPPNDAATDSFADICGSTTRGPHDQACFSLVFGATSEVIAQRSTAGVFGYARSTRTVAAATADDPTLFALGEVTLGEADAGVRSFSVNVTAAGAGDGDIVLRDGDGAEIDRVTLHARASDRLALDGDASALVLAGEVTTFHVTTMTAGAVTIGTGAVAFTPSGGVTAVTRDAAPYLDGYGDTVYARVDGDGAILAEAPDATASVSITAVAASALTAITANPTTLSIPAGDEKYVAIGATAGGTPVYGPRCTWSSTNGLTIALGAGLFAPSNLGLGNEAVYHYKVEGPAGDYHPICTLPGGLAVTVPVHIGG